MQQEFNEAESSFDRAFVDFMDLTDKTREIALKAAKTLSDISVSDADAYMLKVKASAALAEIVLLINESEVQNG